VDSAFARYGLLRGDLLGACTAVLKGTPPLEGPLPLRVLGALKWQSATWIRENLVAARRIRFRMVPGGYFHLRIDEAAGQAGKSGQLATFIQQRIGRVYRRQRTTPLPSRTAKSHRQAANRFSLAAWIASGSGHGPVQGTVANRQRTLGTAATGPRLSTDQKVGSSNLFGRA
jgi:hypothetical protein